jgi:hypothetical protein
MGAAAALGAMATFAAVGQPPVALDDKQAPAARPRQPGGLLGDQLGRYLTIEGVKAEGVKLESGTLQVDTVDGKKLANPILLVVRGAYIADHNLQPARLDFPSDRRCILKGFESGEMIGVPPAVRTAAQEQGWTEIPMSPVDWQWRPHFVALVVVEPKELELRKQ